MAPRSQKAEERPISFTLQSGDGEGTTVPLVIRPEDLRRSESGLQSQNQTFGGGFIDNWGRGLTPIQISGHTGWGAGNRPSGEAEFKKLHELVWLEWYRQRAAAAADGKSPDTVKLIFADALNDYTAVVSPNTFTLTRNRSRPLLMMYQISMTAVSDRIDAELSDPLDFRFDSVSPTSVAAGVKSLQSSLGKLQAAAANVRGFVDTNLVRPLGNLMKVSNEAFGSVLKVVDGTRGVIGGEAAQFVGIARDLAQVSRNVVYSYAAIATLPDFARHQLASVASEYENAYCVLTNVFRQVREYPDYDGLYGASVCSSTVGGSSLSAYMNSNPWEDFAPSQALPVAVSPLARSNMEFMKATDPVLRPLAAADLIARMSSISEGVSFT